MLQDLLQVGQIGEELLRRLVAVGLVGGVRLVPEGGFRRVKGDHHPLGAEPLAVLQQRLEKAVGHRGGDAGLGAQAALTALGKGVEAAERQRVAIHQEQQGLGRLWRGGAARIPCGHGPTQCMQQPGRGPGLGRLLAGLGRF